MQTHSSIFSILRFSEFIALISLSTTLFLFLHTRDLALQLDQERRGHEEEAEQHPHFLSRELSTAGEERTEYYGQVRVGLILFTGGLYLYKYCQSKLYISPHRYFISSGESAVSVEIICTPSGPATVGKKTHVAPMA